MQFEKNDKLKHYKKHTCKNEWKSISFLIITLIATVQKQKLFKTKIYFPATYY